MATCPPGTEGPASTGAEGGADEFEHPAASTTSAESKTEKA
jgi:hypothetical protein